MYWLRPHKQEPWRGSWVVIFVINCGDLLYETDGRATSVVDLV